MQNLLNTASDLIRITSTAEQPKEIRRAVTYVKKFFSSSKDLIIREYECNGKPAIVVSTVNSLTPDILMIGHLDVVHAEPGMFDPCVKDGRLIGRGACDMKSEDAVMMHVLRTVSKDKKQPSIALILTTDEETGGMNGVRYLVDEVGYRCKVALVPDGGELPEEIIVESKGVVHIRLSACGKSAHGSVPWKGENAIERLIHGYQKIQKILPNKGSGEHWYATCNLGTINGGQTTNQVPDKASCTLDVRHPGSISREEIITAIKKAAKECVVEILVAADASITDTKDPYLQSYVKLFRLAQKKEPRLCRKHGAHDGRFLTSQDIPVIISRPLSGGQHSDYEWVDLKSLENFYQLYLSFVRSLV